MIQRLRKLLRPVISPDSFRGAVLTLLSGSGAAVVIAFLAQPVLTRLYSPEAFGALDSFLALVAVLAPLVSLRYEDAIMLPESERDAGHVFWLTTGLVLFATMLTTVLGYLLAAGPLRGVDFISGWWWLLPLALVSFRGMKLFEFWLTRHQRYRSVAAGQLIETFVRVAVRIGLGVGVAGIGITGLLAGYYAGLAVALLLLAAFLMWAHPSALFRDIEVGTIRQIARRYQNFPRFSAPSQLFYALSSRLPFLLLLVFFGEAVVGQFGRAFVVVAVPMSVLGASVARVFKIRGVNAERQGELSMLVQRVHASLVQGAFFPVLAVIASGPVLLGVLFGGEWLPAGRYLYYVGPWLLFAGLASPLTPVFDILERQQDDLRTGFLLFIFPAAALLLGGYSGNLYAALLLAGIAGAISRLYHINKMLSLADVPLRVRYLPYIRAMLHSLPLLAILIAVLLLLPPLWAAVGTAALIAVHALLFARELYASS